MFILKLNLMVFYFLALLNEPAIFIRMSTSYIVFNYYWVELFLFNVLLLSLLGLIMFFTAQSSKKINSVEKKYVLKNINILLNYIFIVVLVYLILQLLFVLVNNSIISQVCLSGFLVVNSLIYFAKVLICFIFLSMYLFLFSYIQSCWLSLEFLLLLGFLLLLSLFILSANDLFFLYLLVEGLTFIIILLMASYQKSLINLESAIKYFILGAVSSSLLVFSVFWFFLILHLTNITELGIFFSLLEVNFFYQEAYYFFMTPTLLLIVAFFIKLGAFPFNIWVPDVYEGCITVIMFFLMVGIKTVYIFVLIRILLNYFYFFFPILSMIFAMSATGCFIVGSLGAFSQFNIKRFLAYTSLNQLGFILLGLSSSLATIPYVLLFVIVYIVNNIIFFGVIFSLKNTDKHSFVFIEDLKGLSYFYPAESCFLSIALLSFIGMPPLAGFFSKFFILQNAIKAGFFFEVLFALLCNIVSGFYYLRIIKFIWLDSLHLNYIYSYSTQGLQSLVGLCCFFNIFLFFFLNWLIDKLFFFFNISLFGYDEQLFCYICADIIADYDFFMY